MTTRRARESSRDAGRRAEGESRERRSLKTLRRVWRSLARCLARCCRLNALWQPRGQTGSPTTKMEVDGGPGPAAEGGAAAASSYDADLKRGMEALELARA